MNAAVHINRYADDLVECLVVGGGRVAGCLFAHRDGKTLMGTRIVTLMDGTKPVVVKNTGGWWQATGLKQDEWAQSIRGGGA